MIDKILETASSHPLYAFIGVAALLYLGWALLKRVIRIIIIAAVLFVVYMVWMYLHPQGESTGQLKTDLIQEQLSAQVVAEPFAETT